MGMGGLIKAPGKTKQEDEEAEPADEDVDPITRVPSKTAIPSWINFGRAGVSEAAVGQRQRKKSVAEVQEEEDDRHIRFTIGGVGRRMTKVDFIKEMQKLEQNTRKEVVDRSTASHTVKTLAKQDAPEPTVPPAEGAASGAGSSAAAAAAIRDRSPGDNGNDSESDIYSRSSSSGMEIGPSSRRERVTSAPGEGDDVPETAVERRRRLAALEGVDDSDDSGDEDTRETPAERRRREAALGMASQHADDSDDDDTPRVPPARRGIRFADTPGVEKS